MERVFDLSANLFAFFCHKGAFGFILLIFFDGDEVVPL